MLHEFKICVNVGLEFREGQGSRKAGAPGALLARAMVVAQVSAGLAQFLFSGEEVEKGKAEVVWERKMC
jgi:hypothetical protein